MAWRALLGETGLPWQAEALTTMRQGAGIVLVAPPPLGPTTTLLLAAEHIRANPDSITMLIAPDEALLNDLAATARNVDALLGGGLPHLPIDETTRLPHRTPPLLLLTPETLHRRVLRTHNRGWATVWSRLQAVVLPAIDQAPGTVLGHTRWLLRRITRLRPIARPLTVYASIAPLADIEETLTHIFDVLPPVVAANTSRVPLTWALWRGGAQPVEAAIELAIAIRSAGLSVHLETRDPLERALLAQRGATHGLVLAAGASAPTHTLIMLGATDGTSLPALTASGYRAVVLITDESIAAQVAIEQPALLTPAVPAPLPISRTNSYVASAHLRCAAEEQPLTRTEVTDWEATALVDMLTTRGVLAQLPGTNNWQPVGNPDPDKDAYANLHPASASGGTVAVHDETGTLLARVDAVSAERRLYPGAVIRGGRVVGWGDDGSITVRGQSGGRTVAERRTQITVREQVAERTLDGGRADTPLRAGRVLVAEDIVARRGLGDDGSVRRVPFDPPLHAQWSAPAIWLAAPHASNQLGEMLIGVVPLLLRCFADNLVACVADDTLYLVEAQPGGRGLVDHLYMQFEAVLHLAGLAARTLSDDALLGANARADLAWLATILMPLSGIGEQRPTAEQVLPQPKPNVERRTRASMVATPNEVAARRRTRGNTFAVPRSLPPRQEPPGMPYQPGSRHEAAPPAPSSLPAQPMRLPAQPPLPPREPQPARPTTRTEPPPPRPEVRPKISAPRPARRRANQGAAAKASPAPASQPEANTRRSPGIGAPPEFAKPPVAPRPTQAEQPPPGAVPPPKVAVPPATTLPTRREPPPLERPPFQEKANQGAQPKGYEPRARNSEHPAPKPPYGSNTNRDGQPPNRQPPVYRGSGGSNQTTDSNNPRHQSGEQRPSDSNRQPPPVESSSDPAALLAKARRLREQREAEVRREQGPPRRPAPQPAYASIGDDEDGIESSRFSPGDRVFCVPYGEGVVQKTRIREGRELLLVHFPDLGNLRVDPAVNAVRLIEVPPESDPDQEE